MDKNQAGIILVNGTSKARGNGVRRLKGKKYARPVITSWRWLLPDALGREKRWMDLSALKLGEFAHRKAKTRYEFAPSKPHGSSPGGLFSNCAPAKEYPKPVHLILHIWIWVNPKLGKLG